MKRFKWRSRTTRPAVAVLLLGSMLSVAPVATAASSDSCAAGMNPVVCENQKPGTPESTWDINGVGDPSIQGFATDMSVDLGQTENFKIETDASAYTIAIYRLGYYQGDGARLITTVKPSARLPQVQPACVSDPTTYDYDCGTWAVSASWTVPSDAVSGVYIATLTRTDTGGKSQIPFVVRDDSSHSDIVFQTSDPTWEAYNTYGGSDFYTGGGSVGRAYKISYNRPFATRGDNSGRDYLFSNEFPAIRFLEKNGYDVTYISGVDTDRYGATLLTNHKLFVSVGHDEYWSIDQRANVEAARAAGVNLAFFSGNEVYWRTRWENSIDGLNTPYRTLVSYKETWASAPIDPLEPAQDTATWRDPRFGQPAQPENGLTGTIYMSNTGGFAIQVPYAYSKDRLWRNTSVADLTAGQTATLGANTLGYEFDSDLDNGSRPAGLIDLSSTTEHVDQKLLDYGNTVAQGTVTHNLTLYRASSGALVFGAGTVQWAWGLDDDHDGTSGSVNTAMQQATVNLFADMGIQPQTLMSGLVTATRSSDTTAPTPVITTPTASSTVTVATPTTVAGTATDVGGVVAGIEVSVDGGQTWHPARGTDAWSYTWVPTVAGSVNVEVRATDDSANTSTPIVESVTVLPRTCPCSIWPDAATPAPIPQASVTAGESSGGVDQGNDPNPTQLGVKFQTTVDGYITGIRFYKAAANTGTHTGSLWSASGQLLATATFTDETATGWQQVSFNTAVAVKANTTYVASYFAPNGHYSADSFYFETSGVTSEPLIALSNSAEGGNGVYSYGSDGIFPSNTFDATNYWVDPVFVTSNPGPSVTKISPQGGAEDVSLSSAISATFDQDVLTSSVAITLTQPGLSISGTVTYNATTRTVSFTPASLLAPGTTYTAVVHATSASTNRAMLPDSWSFTTTTSASPCPCSLWPVASTPMTGPADDAGPVNVGVKFQPDRDGYITGLRFYKTAENTGTHVGSVWSSTGQLLAVATFTDETSSGWQSVTFSNPVAVISGNTYVASYFAPNGHYVATNGYFTADAPSSGSISAPSDAASGGNGVYAYASASAFPTLTYGATNYWVDVSFTAADLAPAVTSVSPPAGAVGIEPTTTVSATFDGPVDPSSLSFVITSVGAQVAGTFAYNNATDTVTFAPSSALQGGVTFQATVTAKSLSSGAQMQPYSWSFTTAATSGACPCSLWSGSVQPATPSTDDSNPVEVGVKFEPTADGYVTGVRFYKGSGNTGTHTGSLWTLAGQLLTKAVFMNETDSGWQTVTFAEPVPVVAGTTYIASYYAPNGHYSASPGYFNTAYTAGPLTAPSSQLAGGNGVFQYGTGGLAPLASYNATNYWVDVVFDTTAQCPCSLWSPSATPAVTAVADPNAVELGLRFESSEDGDVTGVRFYKGVGNTGTHTGSLWTASGALLATVDFTDETPSGWQTANFPMPIAITAGTVYIVSYYAPEGDYAATSEYFGSSGFVNGPLTAVPSLAGAGNGVYAYGGGGVAPTESFGATNYWVDVIFAPSSQ